ncbi:hypothetical protein AB5I41_02990 [Sphingomonas sp. MMS24-JH45]
MAAMDWKTCAISWPSPAAAARLSRARTLRVSQTTTARRIAALEAALGLALFERRPARSPPHPDRRGVAAPRRSRRAGGDRAGGSRRCGAARCGRGRAAHHHGDPRLDHPDTVARRLARRPPAHPHRAETSGRGCGTSPRAKRRWRSGSRCGRAGRGWSRGASPTIGGRSTEPHLCRAPRHAPSRTRLSRPCVRRGGEPAVWTIYRQWLAANGLEDAVAFHHNSSIGLLAAVRGGAGLAVLPTIVAENAPDLVRCGPPAPPEERGIRRPTSDTGTRRGCARCSTSLAPG